MKKLIILSVLALTGCATVQPQPQQIGQGGSAGAAHQCDVSSTTVNGLTSATITVR